MIGNKHNLWYNLFTRNPRVPRVNWSFAVSDKSEVQRPKLTPTERLVVDLVSQGLTNKEVAARLGRSPLTIKSHLNRISGKCGGRHGRADIILAFGTSVSSLQVHLFKQSWDSLNRYAYIIASLAAQGMTNQQISSRIGISVDSVKYRLRKIFQQLGVSRRFELVEQWRVMNTIAHQSEYDESPFGRLRNWFLTQQQPLDQSELLTLVQIALNGDTEDTELLAIRSERVRTLIEDILRNQLSFAPALLMRLWLESGWSTQQLIGLAPVGYPFMKYEVFGEEDKRIVALQCDGYNDEQIARRMHFDYTQVVSYRCNAMCVAMGSRYDYTWLLLAAMLTRI